MTKSRFIGLGNMAARWPRGRPGQGAARGHRLRSRRASRDAAGAASRAIIAASAVEAAVAAGGVHCAAGGRSRRSGVERNRRRGEGGALLIDCSTVRRRERAEGPCPCRGRRPRVGRCAGLRRRRRRQSGFAHLHVRRGGAAFAAAKPILETMGRRIVHCGEAGAGQAAKICNNMILGATMIVTAEAFALAEKLGLSPRRCSTSPRPRRARAGR